MDEETRTRAAVLAVLVAAGVALGVAGATLGVGGPTTSDPAAEFVVGSDNVSVRGDGERATLVTNASEFEAVEIEQADDGFTVDTTDPLNASQRERARAIARENATVAAHLDGLDGYELAVEPVVVLNASTAVTVTGDVETGNWSDGTDTATGRVTNFTVSESDGDSVTVEREQSYADDLATVEVRRPDGPDREFVAHVDLQNETVTRVVDRTDG